MEILEFEQALNLHKVIDDYDMPEVDEKESKASRKRKKLNRMEVKSLNKEG